MSRIRTRTLRRKRWLDQTRLRRLRESLLLLAPAVVATAPQSWAAWLAAIVLVWMLEIAVGDGPRPGRA